MLYNKTIYSSLFGFLFKETDNFPLVIFRIIFGLLIFLESVGAIFTGWVKNNLIDPDFTFTFFGFEWLQPLPGFGMYFYFLLMGAAGILVMLGWYYRTAMLTFAILWTGVYLMQKTSYNNHYYLLVLLSFLMASVPANRSLSLDVKFKRVNELNYCPNWCILIFVLQLFIVYTYAAVSKMNPDWLKAIPLSLWFKGKASYPLIGQLLVHEWTPYFIAWGGILYDLFIVPLMLWRRTRVYAFGASLFFHLFNSAVFQIGIFPYLMIGMKLFFFPPEQLRKFFKFKLQNGSIQTQLSAITLRHHFIAAFLIVYFIIQALLPVRHHFIKGNVNWTEEGHRMSWRMMLRTKTGSINFIIIDKQNNKEFKLNPYDHLAPKQASRMAVRPDMVFHFVQYIKQYYQVKGITEIEIYAISRVSLNGKPHAPLIQPDYDLAKAEWRFFCHNEWLTETN